jgi:hypothetical protein
MAAHSPRPVVDAELGSPPPDCAWRRTMAVSRWRGEGRTQEGRRWEGMNAELASADAREGRQPKSMFAGGGAAGGRGAPRTTEEAAGGRQLRDGENGGGG